MKAKNGTRFLIVNADDFGLTSGVNRGIIEAHEHGIVTSASVMVRHAAAKEAAKYARAHPALSMGLHFDLEEWRYRGRQWELTYRNIDRTDARSVWLEFDSQLATFERLLGRKPTHLDSHQHIHLAEPARSILLKTSEELHIPLRSCCRSISYRGSFYGQTDEGRSFPAGISAAAFSRTVLASAPGWTEMGCHPGYSDGLDSVYSLERVRELRVLCSPKLRASLKREGVKLCSFTDFALAQEREPAPIPPIP